MAQLLASPDLESDELSLNLLCSLISYQKNDRYGIAINACEGGNKNKEDVNAYFQEYCHFISHIKQI